MSELTIEDKARLWDELTDRIAEVRARYESPRTQNTFNSVFSNGMLAGLQVIESEFDDLTEFRVDKPHMPGSDVKHLIDDRSSTSSVLRPTPSGS